MHNKYMLFIIFLLIIGVTAAFADNNIISPVSKVQNYTYNIINTYPHDPDAFTEGLAYYNGIIVESTGPEGNSTIRIVNLTTGAIEKEHHLPVKFFGEGATVFGDKIAQETETQGFGMLYNVSNLDYLGTFNYSTDGWGITYDGENLIMSDGTSTLHYINPETYRFVRNLSVTLNGEPVRELNELEYINGEIFANIWPTYNIARISPESGNVTGWIDLSGIISLKDRTEGGWSSIDYLRGNTSIPFIKEDCPNGIAYDSTEDRLFVTGKLWPEMFQIELIPVDK